MNWSESEHKEERMAVREMTTTTWHKLKGIVMGAFREDVVTLLGHVQ